MRYQLIEAYEILKTVFGIVVITILVANALVGTVALWQWLGVLK